LCVSIILTTSSTGIGPEVFAFASSDGNFTGGDDPTQYQQDFYAQHGFYITAANYILRPEVLESNFYAWRATGDTKYLDRAAAAVESFNIFLPAKVAFAGIDDVNDPESSQIDDMPSFWLAEVLKYLYVLQQMLSCEWY
jgi:mannosyl-oligosaccharide alpha-1,2-mannosidase